MFQWKEFYKNKRMEENMVSRESIKILMISKTSFDKAACGNTILQNDVFSADELEGVPIPVTRSGSFRGRFVEVTDTPGLMDSYSKIKSKETIEDYLRKSRKAYDAVVIVLRYPVRMTPEEEESVQMIKDIIGEDPIWKFGILLFTNGASFKRNPNPTFEEYLDREVNTHQGFQNAGRISLGKLITDVRHRCVLFDNDTDDVTEVNMQIQILLEKIDQLKKQNNNSKFEKGGLWQRHPRRIMAFLAAVAVAVVVIVVIVVTTN